MLALQEALDNKAWESGHVTGSRLKEILDDYRKESVETIDRQLHGMRAELRQVIERGGHVGGGEMDGSEVDLESGGMSGGGGRQQVKTVFAYDGQFFAVPKGYKFPKANLRDGLRCWLQEQVVSVDGKEKVKALRTISASMLPTTLARQFFTNWQPIFKYLEPVLESVPRDKVVTDEDLERVYNKCMDFFKRASVIFVERALQSKGI
jgi:hypothetical protein